MLNVVIRSVEKWNNIKKKFERKKENDSKGLARQTRLNNESKIISCLRSI